MRRIALSGLMAVALSSAAFAQGVTIQTAQGPVELPAKPQTVAVYDMAALDTLQAMGVTPAGTIDKILVPALREGARDAAHVGTLFEPDLEALAGLAPDLVIVGGRSSTQLQTVSQVATAIDMTIDTDLLPEARARIDAYGTLFGKEDRAAQMHATLDEKLAALKKAAEGHDA